MMAKTWVAMAGFLCVSFAPYPALTEFTFERARNFTGLDHAGYAFLSDVLPGSLLLNRFGAAPLFGKSQVSLVNLTTGGFADLATNIDWPNVATVVDEKVFGFKAAIIGSGFLVPSHTTGGVWIVELSTEPKVLTSGPVKITKDLNNWKPDSGWFYHKGDLIDMNGDGLLDIVTSRCAYSVEPWNSKAGILVWLEHPANGALGGAPWKEHTIQKGPDFLFEVAPKAVSGNLFGACAAEYIGEKLSYIYGSEKIGFSTRVVDAELGHGFGCTWVDLNGDGKLDLLATNHLNQNGSVFAYTWDGDLAESSTKVQRHVLATGFNAVTTRAGTASPGDAIPFYMKAGAADGKPLVLVSADNGNYLCYLVPNAPHDPTDWTYSKKMIEYIGADVGRPAIGDTDGDGLNEIFVPAYDAGQIVQFKLQGEGEAIAAAPTKTVPLMV
jgi:hypothetical protein